MNQLLNKDKTYIQDILNACLVEFVSDEIRALQKYN
jgi:hypothetical protein